MVPAEFQAAQHIDPKLVLGCRRNFSGIVSGIGRRGQELTSEWTGASNRRANLRRIHDFTTEVEGQLVRGLEGGIKAGHPDAVISVSTTTVVEGEVVEGGTQFQSGAGRRQGHTSIIAGSGASTGNR